MISPTAATIKMCLKYANQRVHVNQNPERQSTQLEVPNKNGTAKTRRVYEKESLEPARERDLNLSQEIKQSTRGRNKISITENIRIYLGRIGIQHQKILE